MHRAAPGETVRMDKLVAICTSRDPDDRPGPAARPVPRRAEHRAAGGFDAISPASRAVWEQLWDDCDCEVVGDTGTPAHCGSASTTC